MTQRQWTMFTLVAVIVVGVIILIIIACADSFFHNMWEFIKAIFPNWKVPVLYVFLSFVFHQIGWIKGNRAPKE